RTLIAEVRQRDQHAVNLVAVLAEELSVQLRLTQRFNRAVSRIILANDDGVDARAIEYLQNSLPPADDEMFWKDSAIAHDHRQRDRTAGNRRAICEGRLCKCHDVFVLCKRYLPLPVNMRVAVV